MDRGRATCGGQKPRAPTASLSINGHYWVLISLLLTIIATVGLLVETQTISYFADRAADPTKSGDDLRTLGNTLVHSVGSTVVLLVILVLNVYKPRGMTRYG